MPDKQIERMKQLVNETQEIEEIIEKAGAFGVSMCASLFRLALNEIESGIYPSNTNIAAKSFLKLMKDIGEKPSE